jgi:hypothetical protein
MRVAAVAFVLMLGVVAVLWYSDTLNPYNPWALIGPSILLVCTPISLALFVFLAHRQQERHKE